MQQKLFFITSKRVARRLTEVFDFVWPTAAAIWNLRWQVRGYLQEKPLASEAELAGRFIAGSGIRGANLRRACEKTPWEQQQQEFARFLLTEFCSLYESWCSGVLEELGLSDDQCKTLKKDLQFGTKHSASGIVTAGVQSVIRMLNEAPSTVMTETFYLALTSNKKYSKLQLEELMTCYRYFKELRNNIVHSGGVADQQLLEAERKYELLTPSNLGVKEVPAYARHRVGDKLTISLRGVVGFGEAVLRLVCTLDAELATSQAAETAFVKQWNDRNGIVSLSSKADKRAATITRRVRKMDLPDPVVTPQLDDWLKAKRLIN